MIWILIFMLIMTKMDSPFAIPHLNKYVKRHVAEDSRKGEMIDILQKDKKHRKSFLKKRKQHMKELNQINFNRDATRSDFENVFAKIIKERELMQVTDAQLKMKTAELITEEEWAFIKQDATRELTKSIGDIDERFIKFDDKYDKFINNVSLIINNEERKNEVLNSLKEFRENMLSNLNLYKNLITDENTSLYKLNISQDEMDEVYKKTNQWRLNLFEGYEKNHFNIVENTTQEEWKQIAEKAKKLKY